MIEYLWVRIGGGAEHVRGLLAGLPGDHRPDDYDDDRYLVATTDARFLAYAIDRQGYGTVLGPDTGTVPPRRPYIGPPGPRRTFATGIVVIGGDGNPVVAAAATLPNDDLL